MKAAINQRFHGDWRPFFEGYLGELKPVGKQYRAICPFHNDHHPSMDIEPTRGQWHCKPCDIGGDSFKLVAKMKGLDFPAVLHDIATKFGITGNGSKPKDSARPTGRLVKRYTYQSADGSDLFCKNRYEPKGFSLCRPDGNGGYLGGMGGIPPVLYQLPQVNAADEVWIAEGEKDCDSLADLGITATTNYDGAGKWSEAYNEHLKDKQIILVPDCDDPGRAHMHKVAAALQGVAASIKILELPNPTGQKGLDVSDFIAEQSDPETAAERLAIMAEGAAEYVPTVPDANPWARTVIDFDTLRSIELPERRTFLFPWLSEQSITLIYSWRGTGKSFFVLGILDAVTKGKPFGPWEAVEPVPCLYLDAEMPAGMLQERAEEMEIGRDTQAPARLISMNYALDLGLPRKNLLDPEWRGQLLEILIAGGYKLFFIDNISSLTPEVEENAKQAWDVINQWALELRFRGVSTVFLHHAGKSGAQRGTSGREDNVDTSILLKRPTDYELTDGCRFVCAFEKDRCTEGRHLLMEYEFQYQDGVWTCANSKTKGREQVLRLLDQGKSQKDVADELSKDKGWVSRVRKEAIKAGWLTEENKLSQSGFLALLGEQPKSTGKSTG